MSILDPIEEFKREMNNEETSYLKRIWSIHDPSWSEEKLEIIRDILISRGEELPLSTRLLMKDILLTTIDSPDNINIIKYLGIETAGVIIYNSDPLNSFQKRLNDAKEEALEEICLKAVERGGNGIIGLKFNVTPFNLPSMVQIINLFFVSGTVIKYEKN